MDSSNKHEDGKVDQAHVEIKPLIDSKTQLSNENNKEGNFQRRRSSSITDAARSGRKHNVESIIKGNFRYYISIIEFNICYQLLI